MKTTQAKSGRRTFLRRSGAAAAAMLASAAAAPALAATDDASAIRRLYQDYAANPVRRAFEDDTVHLRVFQDPARPLDRIELAADGRSARAQFGCIVQVAAPLAGDAPLIEMARLQGQHRETWWETGVHELDCVKTADVWKIRRLGYRRTGP